LAAFNTIHKLALSLVTYLKVEVFIKDATAFYNITSDGFLKKSTTSKLLKPYTFLLIL
jgi:hypothetical protein